MSYSKRRDCPWKPLSLYTVTWAFPNTRIEEIRLCAASGTFELSLPTWEQKYCPSKLACS